MDLQAPVLRTSILVRTIYDYTPEGCDLIISGYKKQFKYHHLVDCRFNPARQTFLLQGDTNHIEHAFVSFQNILQKFNNREASKLMNANCTRNQFTFLNTLPVRWTDRPQKKAPDGPMRAIMDGPSERNALVKPGADEDGVWPCSRFWAPNCSPQDFTKILELDTSPTKPELLSIPGECFVFPDWSNRRVIIKAENDGIIDKIIRKLECVHQLYNEVYDTCISHLVHVDDRPKMMFKIVPLNKQPDRWQRTIYDFGSQWWYEDPSILSSVRLLVWDGHEKEFVRCKVGYMHSGHRYYHPTTKPREWAEYLFVRKESKKDSVLGESQLNHLAQLILHEEPIPLEEHITSYFDDSQAVADAKHNTNGGEIHNTGSSDPRYGMTTRQPKPRHGMSGTKTQKGRISMPPDGITPSEISDMALSSVSVAGFGEESYQPMENYVPAFLLGYRPVQSVEQQESLTTRKIKQRKDHEASPVIESEKSRLSDIPGLGSRPVNNELEQGPGLTTRQPKPRNAVITSTPMAPASVVTPSVLPFGPRPPAQPVNSDEFPSMTARVPKARKGAAIPAAAGSQKTKENNVPPTPPSEVEIQDTVVTVFTGRGPRKPKTRPTKKAYSSSSSDNTCRVGTGVSVRSETGDSEVNLLVDSDEESTRTFKNTMKQMAPSRAIARVDKDSEQLRRQNNTKLSNDFRKAFEHVRSFRGHLRFESQIGRLAFADINKGSIRDPIEPNNWRHFITNEVTFRTVFTTAVTRDHNDIEYILDLPANNHGENLFSSNPVDKYVMYEFYCSVDNKECVLEIDAHTFDNTCYGPWTEFASAYIANPLHNWDHCVTLNGRKMMNVNEGSSLKTLMETLECIGDKTAILTFENPHTDLIVNKVLVKRVTRYNIEPENIIKTVPMNIVITEVQHLMIREKKLPNGVMKYQARAKDRQHRLWYTVSIVPTQMNDILSENLHLGVGETVNWASEDLLGYGQDGKGLNVSTLTAATNILLRKIDSVGYMNDNTLTQEEQKKWETIQAAAYPEC